MTASSSQILVGRAGVEPTTNGLKVPIHRQYWTIRDCEISSKLLFYIGSVSKTVHGYLLPFAKILAIFWQRNQPTDYLWQRIWQRKHRGKSSTD